MKKNILFVVSLLIINFSYGQITLEETYLDSDFLEIVNLENTGKKYFKTDIANSKFVLYNLDHSIYKTINVPTQTKSGWNILYVSENIFDTDVEIEYVVHNDEDYTIIYNENGTELLTVNTPSYYPPYLHFTDNGLKLIFNFTNKTSSVYSLPGSIVNSNENNFSLQIKRSKISIPYPNPTSDRVIISYQLSNESTSGQIIIYNINGHEVKRLNVDNTFNQLQLSSDDFIPGTYFYVLQTQDEVSETKKLVIE